MEKVRFCDKVFSFDQRNTDPSVMNLAKWLTVEQLQKSVVEVK